MKATIEAVARTTEMRDPYTAGHQRRVAELSHAIAKEMGLSDDRIEGLRMAGIVHDIGKVHVPAEILNKYGDMNEYEFNIIKMHSQTGYDILKNIDFPWPIAQTVLQHHERLNGSGYPAGIVGEQIIIEAKIIAVADVVEAMASHRPYRPALGLNEALHEISRNKGILYDPTTVEACIKLFKKKMFAFDKDIDKRVEFYMPKNHASN